MCKGDGRIPGYPDEICYNCHGIPRKTCGCCAGRGKETEKCETCSGVGQLPIQQVQSLLKRREEVRQKQAHDEAERQRTQRAERDAADVRRKAQEEADRPRREVEAAQAAAQSALANARREAEAIRNAAIRRADVDLSAEKARIDAHVASTADTGKVGASIGYGCFTTLLVLGLLMALAIIPGFRDLMDHHKDSPLVNLLTWFFYAFGYFGWLTIPILFQIVKLAKRGTTSVRAQQEGEMAAQKRDMAVRSAEEAFSKAVKR